MRCKQASVSKPGLIHNSPIPPPTNLKSSNEIARLPTVSDYFPFINCNFIGSDSTLNLIGVTYKHTSLTDYTVHRAD